MSDVKHIFVCVFPLGLKNIYFLGEQVFSFYSRVFRCVREGNAAQHIQYIRIFFFLRRGDARHVSSSALGTSILLFSYS